MEKLVEIYNLLSIIELTISKLKRIDKLHNNSQILLRDIELLCPYINQIGEYARYIYSFIKLTHYKPLMIDCCKLERGVFLSNDEFQMFKIQSIRDCYNYLFLIHNYTLKNVFGITSDDIEKCIYYIDTNDGLCKNRFNGHIINPVDNNTTYSLESIKDQTLDKSNRCILRVRKGRINKSFMSYFTTPELCDKYLLKLHKMIKGKQGKAVSLIILICIKMGIITKPPYKSIVNEFGNIGNRSGYYKYMNIKLFTIEEVEGVQQQLK